MTVVTQKNDDILPVTLGQDCRKCKGFSNNNYAGDEYSFNHYISSNMSDSLVLEDFAVGLQCNSCHSLAHQIVFC